MSQKRMFITVHTLKVKFKCLIRTWLSFFISNLSSSEAVYQLELK